MAAVARPAATVVLVRPAGDRWETYLLRRSSQSPVLADLWVFPGGTVREGDLAPAVQALAPAFSPDDAHVALTRPPGTPAPSPLASYGYFVAACRELLEEAGVVLSSAPLASPAPPSGKQVHVPFAEQRLALERGRPLVEVAADLGFRFDYRLLTYYGHWITPEALPRRFDTRFFIAVLPEGQEASPSPFEMAEGLWIDVPSALERARERTLPLHFATVSHLRRLAPFESIPELLDFARAKPVVPVMPTLRDGRATPFLPDDLVDAW